MSKKMYYTLASLIFAVVGFLHALRALMGWEAVIGGVVVPFWFSWAAFALAWYLAYRGWVFAKKAR